MVKAAFISQTKCMCVTPPYKSSSGSLPKAVALQVSNNGIDFVSSTRMFTYLYHVSVTSITPKHGALEGGTKVTCVVIFFYDRNILTNYTKVYFY